MAFEDDIGWDYFGPDPMASPRMAEHMDWHNDPANQTHAGNYGERFLTFHKQFIDKFDAYRQAHGLIPVTGWDPATPIPPALAHDHALSLPRVTSDPSSIDPGCRTPTWATLAGGSDVDPLHGYANLLQFRSLDELGRSIDTDWHGRVHNTIGGDMSQFHSPIDPIFWRWHRWIDNIRATWESHRVVRVGREITELVRILFGVSNDGGGTVINPRGEIVPVPPMGPVGPLARGLAPGLRDALAGHLIGRASELLADAGFAETARKLSAEVVSASAKQL